MDDDDSVLYLGSQEYDLSDKGDCRGCSVLLSILQTPGNETATDDQIYQQRAEGFCADCLRKPSEVINYNPSTEYLEEWIVAKDGSPQKVALDSPDKHKSRWAPCSPEAMIFFSERKYSHKNRALYSDEALNRFELFEKGVYVKPQR
jgi:hypothetical protein